MIQRTISSNHLRMRKKAVFLAVRNSMNLDINLKIICALKWPMTRLCTLNSSTDSDVVQLIPTIHYISAR